MINKMRITGAVNITYTWLRFIVFCVILVDN